MAVKQAEGAAARALKALAHPLWTPAVVATAAAMAADSTASACARSFTQQVASNYFGWYGRQERKNVHERKSWIANYKSKDVHCRLSAPGHPLEHPIPDAVLCVNASFMPL